ncbi:MAG: peptide chain release factor N(5)-glutamine methyltransferase [Acidimicrobiia bacterium]|nr:peptide chain release factor N(5)-glutamine methyltransferase [Acidimicrobiia bacterium]
MASDETHLADLVRRRLEGEPLQYLEGSASFVSFDLQVDARVLVPRPETEGLWEVAVSLHPDPRRIVDLCTGSGALAIALARSFPRARVVGTDVSSDALDVARLNGARLAPDVEWRTGDLFEAVDEDLRGRVDLLVSNPPYVAAGEWEDLPLDVRREPRLALVSGETGLEVLERIAAEAGEWLAPGGCVACEIGETQGAAVRGLFADYRQPRILTDLAGRERYLVAGR